MPAPADDPVEPVPVGHMAELAELEDEVEAEDEELEAELDCDADEDEDENRLELPRNPVDVGADAEPAPVLCMVRSPASELPEEEEEEDDDVGELALLPLRPAVLTTVICRMVGFADMLALIPPRFPRSRGTIRETYFSAAVTPVTRRVSSTAPFVTAAVFTEGRLLLEELESGVDGVSL